jgi:hypothetical protein
MISCDVFRKRFTAGTSDPDVLEHLRSCDACLTTAIEIDPDAMFRSLGGEMIPPGGVDAFVGDVMRQVHLRATETAIVPPRTLGWTRRAAIAATIAGATLAGLLTYQNNQPAVMVEPRITRAVLTPQTTRPVIESYESSNATIVEVPAENPSDVKIVMIFDESLPVDL